MFFSKYRDKAWEIHVRPMISKKNNTLVFFAYKSGLEFLNTVIGLGTILIKNLVIPNHYVCRLGR